MDSTDNQLRACVKALDDVITPALAADNAQAAEQAFLVTDYLGYLRSRLPYLHDRHRFEARHHLELAQAVVDDVTELDPAAAEALRAAAKTAEGTLADPAARDPELDAAAAGLAAALTGALRAIGPRTEEARRRVERRVVELTAEKITVDRAWHLPQGLDGDPSTVLPLDEALGVGPLS